jgi:hypothetical protein
MLILAQAMLVMGFISLVPASVRHFRHAIEAGMPTWYLYWIVPISMVAGAFKATKVMRKRMRQNITRLRTAEGRLWPWDIYPRPLFIFILSMMVLMYVLKRVFVGNALGLGFLGGIDTAIAVALLMASFEYRRK